MNNEFQSLETERLILRPLTNLDLEFVFRHFSDPDVNRFLLDEEPVTTREQAQAIIDFYSTPEGKLYNRWAIVRNTDRRAIGTCGFHQWQSVHHRAEIGYDLEKASWKQGIMTEALRVMLQYGFEYMELNRVEALVYPENEASVRLLERVYPKQPMRPGQIERVEFDYDRHGTINLLAGLTLCTGHMYAECLDKNDGKHFRPAIQRFLHPYSWAHRTHLIIDNGSSHTSEETTEFLRPASRVSTCCSLRQRLPGLIKPNPCSRLSAPAI